MLKMIDLLYLQNGLRFFEMAPFFHWSKQHGPFFLQVGINTSETMSD